MNDVGHRPLLHLVRHGATEWSASGQHTSRTDIALTADGERQARDLAPMLEGLNVAAVLCSPMQRARRTCELAGLSDRAEVDDDLREWNYGDYEGVTTATIRTTVPGWTVWTGTCPSGESIAEVAARADRLIARVRATAGDTIVFAHGHVLRVVAARWCELDPLEGRRFVLDPATLSTLGWERETPAIRRWNTR
jgi:broad specificity phosphatase PhoE